MSVPSANAFGRIQRPQFGRASMNLGPESAKLQRIRLKLDRLRPKLVQVGAISAELGPMLAEFGPDSSTFWQRRSSLDQVRPSFGQPRVLFDPTGGLISEIALVRRWPSVGVGRSWPKLGRIAMRKLSSATLSTKKLSVAPGVNAALRGRRVSVGLARGSVQKTPGALGAPHPGGVGGRAGRLPRGSGARLQQVHQGGRVLQATGKIPSEMGNIVLPCGRVTGSVRLGAL